MLFMLPVFARPNTLLTLFDELLLELLLGAGVDVGPGPGVGVGPPPFARHE